MCSSGKKCTVYKQDDILLSPLPMLRQRSNRGKKMVMGSVEKWSILEMAGERNSDYSQNVHTVQLNM